MTGRPGRHLSWELFEDLIKGGAPAIEVVVGSPRVEIFTDSGGGRIGVRTPSDSHPLPNTLTEIDVGQTLVDGAKAVEVSTTNRLLYRDFYSFACSVADRVQVEGLEPSVAVEASLSAWASLLQRQTLLSEERELGLMGELWLLRRLGKTLGWSDATAAWKGPDAEEHDFSWAGVDVEVKTTTNERRLHMIGSLTQLRPTPGRDLHLLSLQMTGSGPGEGLTLSEPVDEILALVRVGEPSLEGSLLEKLEAVGYDPVHAALYSRRLHLRSKPSLVPVDSHCPRLTPEALEGLGSVVSQRVPHVAYRVDVTDLGATEGADEFDDIIPPDPEPK